MQPLENLFSRFSRCPAQHIVAGAPDDFSAAISRAMLAQPMTNQRPGDDWVHQTGKLINGNVSLVCQMTKIIAENQVVTMENGLPVILEAATL
jgi:hypothetical protein